MLSYNSVFQNIPTPKKKASHICPQINNTNLSFIFLSFLKTSLYCCLTSVISVFVLLFPPSVRLFCLISCCLSDLSIYEDCTIAEVTEAFGNRGNPVKEHFRFLPFELKSYNNGLSTFRKFIII